MSSASAPIIRRPRVPISDDEAVEKRREQNRQAQARARAKKKELLSQTQSLPEKSSTSKSIVKQKINEEEAKNIISRAVQIGKANGEMRKLIYEKKYKKLKEQSQKRLDNFGAIIENNELAFVNIEEDYDTFKKYIKEHYPDVLKKIVKYHSRTVGHDDDYKIFLKYKPYQDYDYFVFSYEDKDKTITDFSFKIDYSADIRYSVYLNNQYWRMNYYWFQESQGIFTSYSLTESIKTPKDFKEGAVYLDVKYPEVPLEQNTDTIEDVPENKSLVRSKHLYDTWGFYLYEDWYKKKLDEYYAPIFKNKTIDLDPGPPSPSSKAASLPSLPITIVKKIKSRKAESADDRLQDSSSISANSTISRWSSSSSSSSSVMSSKGRSSLY